MLNLACAFCWVICPTRTADNGHRPSAIICTHENISGMRSAKLTPGLFFALAERPDRLISWNVQQREDQVQNQCPGPYLYSNFVAEDAVKFAAAQLV